MTKKNDMKFSAALKKLEKSVERLEEDDIQLEKFIDVFSEGMKCAATCQKKLNDAQQKIEVVLKDFDDQTKEIRSIDDDDFLSEE